MKINFFRKSRKNRAAPLPSPVNRHAPPTFFEFYFFQQNFSFASDFLGFSHFFLIFIDFSAFFMENLCFQCAIVSFKPGNSARTKFAEKHVKNTCRWSKGIEKERKSGKLWFLILKIKVKSVKIRFFQKLNKFMKI